MKRYKFIVFAILLFSFSFASPVYADLVVNGNDVVDTGNGSGNDVNATGGNGSVYQGGGGSEDTSGTIGFWYSVDGARISLYNNETNQKVGNSFDFCNAAKVHKDALGFSPLSKLDYVKNSGSCDINSFSQDFWQDDNNVSPGIYIEQSQSYITLPKLMPDGVTSAEARIATLKEFFGTDYVIKSLCKSFDVSYEEWTSNKYTFLVETIGIFSVPIMEKGTKVAITASEASILCQKQKESKIKYDIKSLSTDGFRNLPFSIYLEEEKLGIAPYTGDTDIIMYGSSRALDTMLKQLGCMTISYKDDPPPPPPPPEIDSNEKHITAYTDSDIITSTYVYSAQGFPRQSRSPYTGEDEGAKSNCLAGNLCDVTWNVDGSRYYQSIVIPEGGDALSWVKWHTPSKPCEVVVTIQTESGSTPRYNKIYYDIIDYRGKQEPPNPDADDRNDTFKNNPAIEDKTGGVDRLTWITYDYWWEEYWVEVVIGYDEDGDPITELQDWGCVHYPEVNHYASLKVNNIKLSHDPLNPTATIESAKSGYGFEINADTVVSTDLPSAVTGIQFAETRFCEFDFETYYRRLERKRSGFNTNLTFYKNDYSQFGSKVHFTPVWFPDGRYTIKLRIDYAYTPVGTLSYECGLGYNIYGSVYDDWHIANYEDY